MPAKNHPKKDFVWINWNPKEIRQTAENIVNDVKQAYNTIKSVSFGKHTFNNTVFALEKVYTDISDRQREIDFLMHVSPKKEIRETARKVMLTEIDILADLAYDKDLYKALKDYEAKKERLEGEDKKLFEDKLREYQRIGFELPAKKRDILKELRKKIDKFALDFQKNINDYRDFIILAPNETGGLSSDFLETLKRDKKGNYIVSLDYPELVPFMENATDWRKRKELAEKSSRKGGRKNIEILEKILKLKDRAAKILGYKNHAEYKLEINMAKTPAAVNKFLGNLTKKLIVPAKKDIAKLARLKEKETGVSQIKFYDIAYYTNQLKKKEYRVDNEKIRKFFPFNVVKFGIFQIYSKLFSLKFEKIKNYPVWHPDVEMYKVMNSDNALAGYFFLDLYPREGKYSHSAMFELVGGRQKKENGKEFYIAPVAAMIVNFKKPTSKNPSLMSHREVEVFFHEFGHVMHSVLSKAKYISQSGTNVKYDFVEAPSQMLEFWVWDKNMLKILSGYYADNKKKLPGNLIKKIIASKKHLIAFSNMRQLVLGMLDMSLHEKPNQNPARLYKKLYFKYIGVVESKKSLWPAGFGHLAGGYDAGYYSYKWSEVFAADMALRFKREGMLNRKTGADYRRWILEKGSSMEETNLMRGFLGREPNNKAFIKEMGIKR